jgi:hypothetical protein
MLNERGVDAYMGVTQLDIIESPIGSSFHYPSKTLDYFKNVSSIPLSYLDDLPPHPLGRTIQCHTEDMQRSS